MARKQQHEWCFLRGPPPRLRTQQCMQQQWNGVFCAVRVEMLYAGQLVRVSEWSVLVGE
jgi:hypothetical protein